MVNKIDLIWFCVKIYLDVSMKKTCFLSLSNMKKPGIMKCNIFVFRERNNK